MAERRKGRGIDDRDVTARSVVRKYAGAAGRDAGDAAARREREERLRASAHARARGLS